MCYFITLGIHESDAASLEKLGQRGLSAWRCENKHIAARFDRDFVGYVLTAGMCSCDLYQDPFSQETSDERAMRLQEKYRKKGWSEAKIKRAVADATADEERSAGLRADARELIARLADASKCIYVFVHMYSGDQTTEEVAVKPGPSISSQDFGSGAYVLECDTLVKVKTGIQAR